MINVTQILYQKHKNIWFLLQVNRQQLYVKLKKNKVTPFLYTNVNYNKI